MSRKQIGINVLANIASYTVGFIINFFLTPYIIRVLGKEAYGFFPLANTFQMYFVIITIALNAMAARFITISYYENDMDKVNKYFNSVLFSNIGISIFLSAAFGAIIVFIDKIFKVPSYLLFDVRKLFMFVFASFIVTLTFSIFGSATYCKNKLSYRSFLTIGESLLRVVVISIAFGFFAPKISHLGFAMLCTSVLVAGTTYVFTKKLLPEVKISLKKFDIKSISNLVSSGIWNSINRIGSVLFVGLDYAIANIYIGVSAAGQYAIAQTAPSFIRTIIPVISNAFGAQITIWYAKKRVDMVISEVIFVTKAVSLILSLPLSIILVFGDAFYKLWVPTEDARLLQILSIMILFPLFISINTEGLQYVFQTANKLKIPSLVTIGIALASITLELIFVKIIGIYAIPLSSGFVTVLYLLLFNPIYAAKILNVKPTIFYKTIARGLLGVGVFSLFLFLVKPFISVNSWFVFLINMAFLSLVGFVVNFYIIVNKVNRMKIYSLVKGKIPFLK